MRSENSLINIATSIYKLSLYLYPASFRREFGPEMVLTFRDKSLFEQEQRGTAALPLLWIAFFFDLISTALQERLQEVYAMSAANFGRIAGAGAGLAGIYWIAILLADLTGMTRTNTGTFWVFLTALAPLILILTCAVLYLQGAQNAVSTLGLAALAFGSLLLGTAMLLYALNVDYDDGRAFASQFFGHLISGLGIAIIGFSFRFRGYFQGWSTSLVFLGFVVALFWPIIFTVHYLILPIDPMSEYSGVIFGMEFVLQALTWMILGVMAYIGLQEPEERPATN